MKNKAEQATNISMHISAKETIQNPEKDSHAKPVKSLQINKCDQCDYKYSSNAELENHIGKKHPIAEKTGEVCEVCEQILDSKVLLIQHMKEEHNIQKIVKYSCNHCDFKHTSSSEVTKHKNSKHRGLRYSCDKCDYTSSSRTELKNHRLRAHED